MEQADSKEITIAGIGASPGICIGKAYIVYKEGASVIEKYNLDNNGVKKEINRFKTAVKNVKNELDKVIKNSGDNLIASANIIETHIAILNDKEFYEKVVEIVKSECVNAEWAIKKVVTMLNNRFQSMDAPYLKERASDISHISDKIVKNLAGRESVDIKAIDKRVVLVATDLSPAEASQIQLDRIKGFITDEGGKASHTGIIVRSLEIPAIFGLKNATRIIKNDDMIIVDGNKGVVIVNPSEETIFSYAEQQEKYEIRKAAISRKAQAPAMTTDGIEINVLGNIELSEEVVSVKNYGGTGIGLFRTEFDYIRSTGFPTESELFEKYKDIIEVIYPGFVTIRTLDINGDKAAFSGYPNEEANPALGLRAIRYCLKKPEVFTTQLRAIMRAALFGNVKVMFPMISNIDEIHAAKKLMAETAESFAKEKIPFKEKIETGIMIEVPSAVMTADILAKEVDFFSIGTNDLIQYAFAIDRGNRQVAEIFNPLHPAIIRMLKQTCDVAENNGIEVAICGEMASDIFNLPILLGLGIKEFSMNAQSIPDIKEMIRNLSLQDTKKFVKKVLRETTASGIIELIRKTYSGLLQ